MVDGHACADAQVYETLRPAQGSVVVIELMNGLPPAPYSCAHRLIAGKITQAMADVVEAVKISCSRRRGPYKEHDPRRGFSLAGAADRKVA
jgi:hypothetical protein